VNQCGIEEIPVLLALVFAIGDWRRGHELYLQCFAITIKYYLKSRPSRLRSRAYLVFADLLLGTIG
jgi:hypothetical protein